MCIFFNFVDFQILSAKISKRTLNGATVMLEQIEQTDSVFVENLHPGTSPDLLMLYFESKGGGQTVKEVTMLSVGTAKVSFESHEGKFFFIRQCCKRLSCFTDVFLKKMSLYFFY